VGITLNICNFFIRHIPITPQMRGQLSYCFCALIAEWLNAPSQDKMTGLK